MPEELRDAALKRDHWQCQAHARDFALDLPCAGRPHAHHVRLRSHGGPDELDNLLTLCARHHDHAHNGDRRGAELAGVIVRS